MDTVIANTMIDMGMEVYQPRRHKLAAGINNASGRFCGNIGVNSCDTIALNRDIKPAIVATTWIYNITTLD